MIFLRAKNESSRDKAPRVSFPRIAYACIIAFATLSSGCEVIDRVKTDLKTAAASHPLTGNPSRTAAQTALNEGIDLYEKGDFNGAIKHLSNSPEIWSADRNVPVQTKALKYMAFSYCVTSRQALCKQQFEKALRLDPNFDLEPGEKGHPLWGRIFDSVKKGRDKTVASSRLVRQKFSAQ